MKTRVKLLLPLSLLFLAIPAFGQAHTVALSWTASPDLAANPGLGYNVYRLAGACPVSGGIGTAAFVKLNTAVIVTAAFSDTTVTIGQFCYYVTVTTGAIESFPSSPVSAVVMLSPPGAVRVTNIS